MTHPPPATLPQALQSAAAAHPDKPAFICAEQVLRYGELQRRVLRLAAALRARHRLEPGARVLLLGPQHPDWVVALYALWHCGAVVVPVNPMSTADDLAYVVADSGARLALLHDAAAARLREATPAGLRVQAWSDALDVEAPQEARADASAQASAAPLAPDALCLLPYTSGTTGRPKGCLHSQATLLASLHASAAWRGFDAHTVFLGAAPLFHMQGLQNSMNLAVLLGATSVLQPRWDALEAAALIERHRVSAWSAAPTMLIDLFANPAALARDLSSLTLVSGGGAALPVNVAAALKQRFGLVYNEAYGMTETASFLLANPVGGGKPACLGTVPPGVDARIVDPDSGLELRDGEVGEIVVHAPQVTAGYWTHGLHPQADDGAFRELGGRRFLRTGDLALRDDEGYFFMRDRLKRMINSAGFKIWPAEVEALLMRHPAVQEACVIAMHDARRGEAVKAVVVPRPGAALAGPELMAWARDTMAHYKAPQAVEFRERLPRAATGKTAWRELQQQQREAEACHPPTGDAP